MHLAQGQARTHHLTISSIKWVKFSELHLTMIPKGDNKKKSNDEFLSINDLS